MRHYQHSPLRKQAVPHTYTSADHLPYFHESFSRNRAEVIFNLFSRVHIDANEVRVTACDACANASTGTKKES